MKETVRYLRERHSLSQSQVALQLGTSRQTYIKFDFGETEPSANGAEALRHYKDSYAVPVMEPCVVSSPPPVYEGVFDGACVRPLGEGFPARINYDSS